MDRGGYLRDVMFRSKYTIDERNAIHIDPRSHLEVSDMHHRYAKNLRLYFQEFVRVRGLKDVSKDLPTTLHDLRKSNLFEQFFAWLDDDKCKPELEECPRSTLDSDVVLYLTSDDQRAPFLLHIDEQGRFLVPRTDTNTDMCNSCSSSSSSSIHRDTTKATVLTSVQPPTTSSVNSSSSSGVNSIRMSPKLHYELLDTGPDGWIFVVRGGHFFAHCKQTKSFPRFHHSTFFAGSEVEFAGALVCESGRLRRLYPHSGHYRPQEKHLLQLLLLLRAKHVPLGSGDDYGSGDGLRPVLVDGQRALHVARTYNIMGEKLKKVEAAYMVPADTLMELLEWRQQRLISGLLSALDGCSSQGQGCWLNHSYSLGHSLDSSVAGSPSQTRSCPGMHTGTPSSAARWTRLRGPDSRSFSEHDGGVGLTNGLASVPSSPWPNCSNIGSRLVNGTISGSPRTLHYPRSQLKSSAENRAQVLGDMLSPTQHCASSYPGAAGKGILQVPESVPCLRIDSLDRSPPWRGDEHIVSKNENSNSSVSRYTVTDGSLLLPIYQTSNEKNRSGHVMSRGSSDESIPTVSPFFEFQSENDLPARIQSQNKSEQVKETLVVDTSIFTAGGLTRLLLEADHPNYSEEMLELKDGMEKLPYFDSYGYHQGQHHLRDQFGYDENHDGNEDLEFDSSAYETLLQNQSIQDQDQDQEYLDNCVRLLLADSPSLRRNSRKKLDLSTPVSPQMQQRSRAPSAQIFAGTQVNAVDLLPRTPLAKSPLDSRDRGHLSGATATSIDERP